MKRKLKCVFCNQDLSKEKYRIDYVLVIVTDYGYKNLFIKNVF